jgi:L-malate glycosyltransferase
MKNQRIIAVHLLNDFSGSPFVLRQSLEVLSANGYSITLYTATPGGNGFLSNINGITKKNIFYQWHPNRWITLLFFLYSQISLAFRLLFTLRKQDIVYINSLLPFGAAIAGALRGCKVLYHVHEVSVKPEILKKFLLFMANQTSRKAIFVSRDLLSRTTFKQPATVIYNALPDSFIQKAHSFNEKKQASPFNILLLCSLKKYKGVGEFIACARQLPDYHFHLVLNATQKEITDFFSRETIPGNCFLHPAQSNVHPFYRDADVVVNLSRTSEWIETFGMTILEAMHYKKPVIIPPIGGITELIADGIEGYRVDSSSIDTLCEKLQLLATNQALYQQLAGNAYIKTQQFSQSQFAKSILRCLFALS